MPSRLFSGEVRIFFRTGGSMDTVMLIVLVISSIIVATSFLGTALPSYGSIILTWGGRS